VKPYRHKLNSEDIATGTILLEKRSWAYFPPPMQEFAVRVGRRRFATRIVAEDCTCVGGPHQHLHLEAGHFRDRLNFSRGAVIEIERLDGVYGIRNG
jgi:hypothetical protein